MKAQFKNGAFRLMPRNGARFFIALVLVIAAGFYSAVAEPAITEVNISATRVFDEPLVSLGGHADARENRLLVAALLAYAGRTDSDDFSSLTGFLNQFPQSPWAASLQLHLGTEYYNYGYYSRALDAWKQAWQRFEKIDDAQARTQADRSLGELARVLSKLGRLAELQKLLDSTANRPLTGPGTQLIQAARQALWMMQNQPEVSFRCGPLALGRIAESRSQTNATVALILQSHSTTNGVSLAQVADMAGQLGMNYQAAFRSPGAPLIYPAVVHWKVGHYAALLAGKGNQVLSDDYTFRGSLWMTTHCVDEEASGYFLVPAGPLPSGWRAVSDSEAGQVWGRGMVSGSDPNATTPYDQMTSPTCTASGMTVYNMDAMLVSLVLSDTPLSYTPPVGPAVSFEADYHSLEANQPATFYYSNLGPKWTCNWIDYITDNPNSTNANVSRYVGGGGTVAFAWPAQGGQSASNELMTQAALIHTSPSSYEMRLPDGSRKEYAQSDGSIGTVRRIFLSQILDPQGNAVTLNYDSQLRITSIVDAIGQATTFSYTNANFPYAITAVSDPFGRSAHLQYNSAGLLTQITDALGLVSRYVYGTNDFVTNLITPYGTTTFSTGISSGVTWLEATDPLGESEYLEFTQKPVVSMSDPAAIVPHGIVATDTYLIYRNSFFWDKKAFADAAGDVTKAKLYHWLHTSDGASASRVLESEKPALENRLWYNYPGQNVSFTLFGVTMSRPCVKARVLDDGSSQLSAYECNTFGNLTNYTDPVGRNFTYDYAANNVDLVQTRMTRNGKNELLSRVTYNSQHRPLTVTDASGQTTTNTFNARGQLLTTTDPLGETTSFSYDPNGYLLAVTGPLQTSNDVTGFTYDSFGRVRTATDTEGYALTFDYDVMDRKTRVTHPDGTFEQYVYSNLDLAASCDRLGRWTTNLYNADRQLVQTRDPLGRVTSYNWCRCGAMTGLTDPMGRTTTWDYDVESRPTAKHYVDGSTVTYLYESATSRLKTRVDEKGQFKSYEYYDDDSLKRLSYPNASVATPTVTFTYDPDYQRPLSMQDGIGATFYTYNPIATSSLGAGKIASVVGPLPNSSVTYQYDALGHVVTRAINGVAQATTYDALSRPVVVTNALGIFQNSYVGATKRPAMEIYPNGQTNLYSYYNYVGDDRLQQILHLRPDGSVLSAFGYAYNSVGQITCQTNLWDAVSPRVWAPAYDPADQMTNVTIIGGPFVITNFAYTYDLAGNRLSAATNGFGVNFSYNSLNQLINYNNSNSANVSFEWDAENRLAAINEGSLRSEFYYDGLGRRAHIIEKINGLIVANNFYLWCNRQICELRDSAGSTVLRRLFEQGESLAGSSNTNYFYTRDHLRSVREFCDATAQISSRYDYDPFGQMTFLEQGPNSTFTYADMFFHAPSGLDFANNRSFDSTTGRWQSRDPLAESAGLNLYAYVQNNPLNYLDPSGLCGENACGGFPDETEEFYQEMDIMMNRISGWSTLPNIMNFVVHTDTKYHNDANKNRVFCVQGQLYKGWELNYFAQGMYDAHMGLPELMTASPLVWKLGGSIFNPGEYSFRDAFDFKMYEMVFRGYQYYVVNQGLR